MTDDPDDNPEPSELPEDEEEGVEPDGTDDDLQIAEDMTNINTKPDPYDFDADDRAYGKEARGD